MITVKSVTSPQIRATYGLAVLAPAASSTFPFVRSETALPASERPMIETVGPITTAGISLLIHLTPAILTAIAIIT